MLCTAKFVLHLLTLAYDTTFISFAGVLAAGIGAATDWEEGYAGFCFVNGLKGRKLYV